MANIRDNFPHRAPSGSMHTDPPEEQVRYKVDQALVDLRKEFMRQAYDERLPIYDAMVARFTETENETLDLALILVRSLRAVLQSPDSPLPGCTAGILRALVLRVRKELVDSQGDSVNLPSQSQFLWTLEALLSALQGSS